MENKNTKELIQKYLAGHCSEQEKAAVESWYLKTTEGLEDKLEEPDYERLEEELWDNITRKNKRKFILQGQWYRYAAAVLLVSVLGVFAYLKSTPTIPQKLAEHHREEDINPGSNKAILTLADGSKIALDDAKKGKIAEQSGSTITKTADGQLVYTKGNSKGPRSINNEADLAMKSISGLNIIETPRGGQYAVQLPDGTKVWLNAASKLSYPSVFIGSTRKVELSGEAYFEVAKNKAMPFVVSSGQQDIKVLGTHFNVEAYDDERYARTTLVEGSVKVSLKQAANAPINGSVVKNEVILKPGQQSMVASNIKVADVDPEEYIAWKDGLFMFDGANLGHIMLKLSRWYDVQVEFLRSDLKNIHFSGTVSRFGNISQVLKKIELTGSVHFKVKGRRVTVMK